MSPRNNKKAIKERKRKASEKVKVNNQIRSPKTGECAIRGEKETLRNGIDLIEYRATSL